MLNPVSHTSQGYLTILSLFHWTITVEDGEGWRQSSDWVLTKPNLTTCIYEAEQTSGWQQPEPKGVEKEIDNRKLQLNATVTFAEDIFIV